MKKYKFKRKLKQAMRRALCAFSVRLPVRNSPPKGRVPVKATFDGVPYTGSLFKYGKPFICWVCLKPYASNWKGPGDTLEVVVWKDEEVRTVEVPAQLKT